MIDRLETSPLPKCSKYYTQFLHGAENHLINSVSLQQFFLLHWGFLCLARNDFTPVLVHVHGTEQTELVETMLSVLFLKCLMGNYAVENNAM